MLRWMSFNVRYSRAKDGSQGWGHRKKLVVERIRAFDPDLLGMQECRDDEQSEYLRANLPEYHFIGIPRSGDGPTADEMAPVWFKQSVFELLDSGVFLNAFLDKGRMRPLLEAMPVRVILNDRAALYGPALFAAQRQA